MGILLMTEATHREKTQVTGTETRTMISVFQSAFQKTGSLNNSL